MMNFGFFDAHVLGLMMFGFHELDFTSASLAGIIKELISYVHCP